MYLNVAKCKFNEYFFSVYFLTFQRFTWVQERTKFFIYLSIKTTLIYEM